MSQTYGRGLNLERCYLGLKAICTASRGHAESVALVGPFTSPNPSRHFPRSSFPTRLWPLFMIRRSSMTERVRKIPVPDLSPLIMRKRAPSVPRRRASSYPSALRSGSADDLDSLGPSRQNMSSQPSPPPRRTPTGLMPPNCGRIVLAGRTTSR